MKFMLFILTAAIIISSPSHVAAEGRLDSRVSVCHSLAGLDENADGRAFSTPEESIRSNAFKIATFEDCLKFKGSMKEFVSSYQARSKRIARTADALERKILSN